jgi:hypothetical protein
MDGDALSIGSGGSLIANLLLFAAMENVPAPEYQPPPAAAQRAPEVMIAEPWEPWLVLDGRLLSNTSACPEPRAGKHAFYLADATLPHGYDAYAPATKGFHACLLVSRHGNVLAVVLRGTSGRASMDRQISRKLRQDWRLGGSAREDHGSRWHTVHLSTFPPGQTSPAMPPLPEIPDYRRFTL